MFSVEGFIPPGICSVFGIDDAALAALVAGMSEGAAGTAAGTTVAAPAAAEAASLAAAPAGAAVGGYGPAMATGSGGIAAEAPGTGIPAGVPPTATLSQVAPQSGPSVSHPLPTSMQEVTAPVQQAMKPAMDPVMNSLHPKVPMPNAADVPRAANRSAPIDPNFDWSGAQDKAERFIKLSKSVQDFGAAMRGEPKSSGSKDRISQVAPQPAAQPYNPPQHAPLALPNTSLVPPYLMNQRISQYGGY